MRAEQKLAEKSPWSPHQKLIGCDQSEWSYSTEVISSNTLYNQRLLSQYYTVVQ